MRRSPAPSIGRTSGCFDCEGYGRSDKHRPINANISDGADDLLAVSETIAKLTSDRLLLYGASSGALQAALFAQREPRRVARGAQRRANNRRPIDRAFVHSIFTRDRLYGLNPPRCEPALPAVSQACGGSVVRSARPPIGRVRPA